MCWRPCIWSSLGVKLRKLDFLLRSQKYDSPFPLAPRSPFHPSAPARLPRDRAQTFIPPCEYIRPPSLHVSNLYVCVTSGPSFFFNSLSRSFHVLLSASPRFHAVPSLISSLAGPLHVFGQYYPRRVRNVLIPFSLIWDLLSVVEAT